MNPIAKTAWWIAVAPLFVIPFLALYVSNDLYFPFITGKNFIFRMLVEVSVAGWAVLMIADRRYRPRFSWIMVSFVLLIGWMAIADSHAVNPHKAFWSNFERMDGFVALAHILALFLVMGSVFTVDRLWRRWWLTFISAAAIVCAYGLFQLLGAAAIHQSSNRLDASLGNAEYLAGYLLLTLGITLWQALESRSKEQAWLRYALLALAVLETVVLVGTLTRGTVVGLVGAAAFGAVAWAFLAEGKSRRNAAVVLGVLIVLVGGLFSLRNAPIVTENPSLQRFASIFSLREALGTRLVIWDMAIEGAKERPLLGWGHDGYNYIFNRYYEPSLYAQEPWFDRAHNIYLDWLVAGGIPALILFLALMGATVLAVLRAEGLGRGERVLLLATLVAYGIQGLAVFDNLFTYIPLAAILAYVHGRAAKPISFAENLPEARGVALQAALPVAAVLGIIVLYMVNVPTYAAAHELIRGLTPGSAETRLGYFKSAIAREPFATQEIREQLLQFAQSVAMSPQVSAATKEETVSFAIAQFQEELARAPEDARLHIQYASFLRGIDRFDESRVASARARELSPRKQSIIIEQGIGAWQAGDYPAARDFFAEAYDLAPESEEFAAYAAAGRIVAGDIAGGKELLLERFGTTTIDNSILGLAYQEAGAWNDLVNVLRLRARSSTDAATGYQLGIALVRAGRITEARAQIRAVIQAFPASAEQGAALLAQLGG
jgi:O-antigen ligase